MVGSVFLEYSWLHSMLCQPSADSPLDHAMNEAMASWIWVHVLLRFAIQRDRSKSNCCRVELHRTIRDVIVYLFTIWTVLLSCFRRIEIVVMAGRTKVVLLL
jgi:hypothetical protein